MKLEHLMDLKAKLYSPVLNVGKGPYGTRYIYNAAEGTFEGPKLKGRVLPGGGDMPVTDANGTMRLDIRVTLETDDGAFIYLQNQGVWRNDAQPRHLKKARQLTSATCTSCPHPGSKPVTSVTNG